MTDTRSETLQRLQAMNAELEAEAQMKLNAARYVWLRDLCKFAELSLHLPADLDAVVDAGMATE
jgi:hypothetical protein